MQNPFEEPGERISFTNIELEREDGLIAYEIDQAGGVFRLHFRQTSRNPYALMFGQIQIIEENLGRVSLGLLAPYSDFDRSFFDLTNLGMIRCIYNNGLWIGKFPSVFANGEAITPQIPLTVPKHIIDQLDKLTPSLSTIFAMINNKLETLSPKY